MVNEVPVFLLLFVCFEQKYRFHGGIGVSEVGLTEYTQGFKSNAEVQSDLKIWC